MFLRNGKAIIPRLCNSCASRLLREVEAIDLASSTTVRGLSTAVVQQSRNNDWKRSERNFREPYTRLLGEGLRSYSDDASSSSSSEPERVLSETLNSGNLVADEGFAINATTTGGFLSADAITEAAEAAALAASLDGAWIINASCQKLITWVHTSTGTEWWASIAIASMGARTLTFPLAVMQIKNTFNMTKAKPELTALNKWYEVERERGNGEAAKLEYTKRMADAWAKHDSNPFKALLPMFAQLPIFIGFFSALRSLAAAQVPSMTSGGLPYAWLSDLTIADPYYVLPVLSSAIIWLSVELNAADGMQGQDPKTLNNMKWGMRALALIMVPITASMPQSVFCYWITSNLWSLIQTNVLKVSALRRVLGLPSMQEMQRVAMAANPEAAAAAASGTSAHGKPVLTFASPPRKAK